VDHINRSQGGSLRPIGDNLLWFPTGGGKTEAYLGLTAFALGIRRLRGKGYDGVGVVSRYTLRLLSIQQFRRALKLITACEMLRVTPTSGGIGWRPASCLKDGDWLWGRHRFSAGLWLGGTVTPNRLEGVTFLNLPGAFEILEGQRADCDPAQITECPACGALMALPDVAETEDGREQVVFLRVEGCDSLPACEQVSSAFVKVLDVQQERLSSSLSCLRILLRCESGSLNAGDLDGWWDFARREFGEKCRILSARPSRPGYFVDTVASSRGKLRNQRIELFCPSPTCPTTRHPWRECLPMSTLGKHEDFQPVHKAVCSEASPTTARQCPIPAVTVDDQIYAWPPSLLVSTVDKFARLAFEPRAAALFGNVEYYHAHEGFYREGCLRQAPGLDKAKSHPPHERLRIQHSALPAPDLIIQDELHLIDGPLGSMVGLYETAVSYLCGPEHRVKYVASTATVREARDQVQALFTRELRQFPPAGLDASDSFFALLKSSKFSQPSGPGRLYLGYSAPGRGALSPQVRVWAVLLQAAYELKEMGVPDAALDPYWTPVGYYTAIRNLAAARGLWRQAIPLRLEYIGGERRRVLDDEPLELSSRIASSRLPGLLNRLSKKYPYAVDAVLSTSMFGTGVDVSRLSLMLVQGQPKTTSSYIQASGRVGRESPGLIVTLLPSTSPRSLDHFEFFTGYHHQLYRGVEPVTVYPFAPRARERAIGPLCVALLRQLGDVDPSWRHRGEGARLMAEAWRRPEVRRLIQIFEERAQIQPELRRPDMDSLASEVEQALLTWREVAERDSTLLMEEYTLRKRPEASVVLGDPQHAAAGLAPVFRNAPQSLREIEPTTGFKI
jgi:hypothetical protein